MQQQIVKIDENGNIRHSKKKVWKKRKNRKEIELKRHSRKKLNNTTRSESHRQFAFTHGARVMKNTGRQEEYVSPYDTSEVAESGSIRKPVDHRCHPAIK